MKKALVFFALFFFILVSQIYLASSDLFNIGWASSGDEAAVGGFGTALPWTGEPPAVPPEEDEEGSSGGGGVIDSFDLDKTSLIIQAKKGVQLQEKIVIKNNRNSNLEIKISQENLTNFIFADDEDIILSPGEEQEILFSIYVSESEERTLISGRIVFQSWDKTEYVSVLLDLKEKAPLFDIKTTLLKKIFLAGQTASADIKILNLGDLSNIDVNLESFILDSNNNTYNSKKEMFAINDSFEGKVLLEIPSDIPQGEYFLTARVSYENISAESHDSFRVIESIINLGTVVLVLIVLILLILITLTAIILRNKIKSR